MKIYRDPKKREMARRYAEQAPLDVIGYRRPYAWTISWIIGRTNTPQWANRRYWEALAIEQNNRAAFSTII